MTTILNLEILPSLIHFHISTFIHSQEVTFFVYDKVDAKYYYVNVGGLNLVYFQTFNFLHPSQKSIYSIIELNNDFYPSKTYYFGTNKSNGKLIFYSELIYDKQDYIIDSERIYRIDTLVNMEPYYLHHENAIFEDLNTLSKFISAQSLPYREVKPCIQDGFLHQPIWRLGGTRLDCY